MSCVRLLSRNYASDTAAANVYKSSENASYPLTNLFDVKRRAKVWRTLGNFTIASGANTIVFREQAGVDLTATLVAGDYPSITIFCVAVKAALEAAGDATYTVSQESDKRLKILSNLGGGATVFELRWATSTGMAAVMGFDAVNLSGAAFYVADDIAIHTDEWVKFDMGVPLNPTDFVLASQRNAFLKISPTAVITLQGNSTDSWTSPEFSQVLDFNDHLLYATKAPADDGLHTEPLRYWRVKIVDPRNPYGYMEFGLIFIGTAVDVDRGCVQFPLRVEAIDRSQTTYSEAGNSYTDEKPQSASISIDWAGLTPADSEALRDAFASFGLHTPFFVALDSRAAFSTAKETWVRWVKNATPPGSDLVSPTNFSMTMRLIEEI